ncbi:hypothetical protein SADUNF_Sadunf18G0095900 [Salix dunnii]|uniref:Uncharacterized protein n=1 Tax=Salix dunnii TaxID=1413687 RepID=A0A835J5A6_9ROSI|nr:hypothetical protein SADUNF_Sadunf18G0095900 [Salix dunnii]
MSHLILSLNIKDEEISRLKSQQNQTNEDSLIAQGKMIAQKDEKLSPLEDQQLLTDTIINKLRAVVDFIWKEFDEAVRINEEGFLLFLIRVFGVKIP